MTRNDLIEHAAYIITEAPELKNAREALYKFYREHYNLYRAETKLSVLLITCLQRYYYYIDIHVSRDDIEYHLWGDEELFKLNEMLFESYQTERAAASNGD